jgi:hypothetical protein
LSHAAAAWVEFENDLIDQDQLFQKFFADGRQFDGQALVAHMVRDGCNMQLPVLLHMYTQSQSADCASLLPG